MRNNPYIHTKCAILDSNIVQYDKFFELDNDSLEMINASAFLKNDIQRREPNSAIHCLGCETFMFVDLI